METCVFTRKLLLKLFILFVARFGQSRQSSGQLEYTNAYENVTQTSLAMTSEFQISLASSVTDILNNLLRNYQRFLRPQYGGPPTQVKANLFIRSMGPISEGDMVYSMDAYFRQLWIDERLKFTGPIHVLALNILLLNSIWKPDTFFYNGHGSYLHVTTRPNKLVRIYQNGQVLYSMRVTIKASCPMDLQAFPMDEQFCPLTLGSYAYTDKDIVYNWKESAPVSAAKGLKLSQFDLRKFEAYVGKEERLIGNFSVISVRFQLQRQLGYFIIQVYVPCTLVVVLSWVSFWLHREATADRIGLGVTAFLTLTTISLEGKGSLPATKYGTYLDWFFILCFAFVIGSVLEFAGVHYYTKFNYGDQPVSDTEEEEEEEEDEEEDNSKSSEYRACRRIIDERLGPGIGSSVLDESFRYYETKTDPEEQAHEKRDPCCFQFLMCLQNNIKYKTQMILRGQGRNKGNINSSSLIDKAARIIFPVSFTTLFVMYWVRLYY